MKHLAGVVSNLVWALAVVALCGPVAGAGGAATLPGEPIKAKVAKAPLLKASSANSRYSACFDPDSCTLKVSDLKAKDQVVEVPLRGHVLLNSLVDLLVCDEGQVLMLTLDGAVLQVSAEKPEVRSAALSGVVPRAIANAITDGGGFDYFTKASVCWFPVVERDSTCLVFRFLTGERAVYDVSKASMLDAETGSAWEREHFRAVLAAEMRWAESTAKAGLTQLAAAAKESKKEGMRVGSRADGQHPDVIMLIRDETSKAGFCERCVVMALLILGQDGFEQLAPIVQECQGYRLWSTMRSRLTPWDSTEARASACSCWSDGVAQAAALASLRLKLPAEAVYAPTSPFIERPKDPQTGLTVKQRNDLLDSSGEQVLIMAGMTPQQVYDLLGAADFMVDCSWEYDVPGRLPRTVRVTFGETGVLSVTAQRPAWIGVQRDATLMGLRLLEAEQAGK